MRRPPEGVAAPIEAMLMRMRKDVAEVYLSFISACYAQDLSLASVVLIDFWISFSQLPCRGKAYRPAELLVP